MLFFISFKNKIKFNLDICGTRFAMLPEVNKVECTKYFSSGKTQTDQNSSVKLKDKMILSKVIRSFSSRTFCLRSGYEAIHRISEPRPPLISFKSMRNPRKQFVSLLYNFIIFLSYFLFMGRPLITFGWLSPPSSRFEWPLNKYSIFISFYPSPLFASINVVTKPLTHFHKIMTSYFAMNT